MKIKKQLRGFDYAEVDKYLKDIEENRGKNLQEYRRQYNNKINENLQLMRKIFVAQNELAAYHQKEKSIINRLLEIAGIIESIHKNVINTVEEEQSRYHVKKTEIEQKLARLDQVKKLLR